MAGEPVVFCRVEREHRISAFIDAGLRGVRWRTIHGGRVVTEGNRVKLFPEKMTCVAASEIGVTVREFARICATTSREEEMGGASPC